MTNARDPMALLQHAAQAGDWQLLEAVALLVSGRSTRGGAAGNRAYGSLVVLLGLTARSYDRG